MSLLVAAGGCASYQPMDASSAAVAASLSPLQPEELAREAAALRHPALPPVVLPADGSLTPQSAAVVAVIQNPSLRAVRDRRGVAAAQVLQAGILPNPQLSYTMDFPLRDSNRINEDTVNAFGVGVSWEVTALIARDANRSAAAAGAQAIDLDTAWQEWQAAMGAKLHATRVLWLGRQRDELIAQAEQAAVIAREAEDNAAAGLVTTIERDAAMAILQKRRSSLLAAEAALRSETSLLKEALGVPPETPVRVTADAESRSEPAPSPGDLAALIEESRLDLAALRAGYASEEEKLRAAVLSQFPKIGLGVTRARDTSDIPTIGFGVTLDLPIFDRGQGRIAMETATRQQLFDELAARTFEARADAARAFDDLGALGPQIAESERGVERLTALVDAIAAARREGDADLTQLYLVRNDLADARIESLKLRQQADELRIAVEVATGRLLGGSRP
jgi:outer membrane protein TolC